MNFYRQIVTKYPFSIICILVIWYLSFFTPPQTELDNVPFIDKWTHLVMYGGTCSVIWIEYWRSHSVVNKWKLAVWAWAAPIIMSGCIELLQEYCTNGRRDGDWADLLANSIGDDIHENSLWNSDFIIISNFIWFFRLQCVMQQICGIFCKCEFCSCCYFSRGCAGKPYSVNVALNKRCSECE